MAHKTTEPAWAKDEGTWKKAKKAVDPEGKGAKYDQPWAVVADVYKKMGGKVGKKKESEINSPVPKATASGIKTAWHFIAAGMPVMPPVQNSPKPSVNIPEEQKKSAEEAAQELLAKNPSMSAATLLNTLKSMGYELVDNITNKVEADSGSSMPQMLRKKESMILSCGIQEAAGKRDGIGPTRFKTVLIQEGLGNLKDCFYYTKEALKNATQLFEGKKIYANHPSRDEEENRPERDVRDILGHFENVKLEEKDGRSMLTADVVIPPEEPFRWARSLMAHSIEYSKKFPDQNFVGLSINASGDASEVPVDKFIKETQIPREVMVKIQKGIEEGMTIIRVVSALTEAVSCDLVTEPGAGGKVLQILEQEKKSMKQEEKKKEDEMKKPEAPAAAPADKAAAPADKKPEDKPMPPKSEQAAPEHGDEQQDVELFKKLIKQYLGDEHGDDMEAVGYAKKAHEEYKKMGHSEEESMEMAGKHIKAAFEIGKKMASSEAEESDESEEKKESEEKCEGEEKKKESEEKKESDESEECEKKKKEAEEKKESEESKKKESEIIALKAEIASLRESLKTFELKEYLDKMLKESGKVRAFTNKFREALGTPKSKEHIDSTFKLFEKIYEAAKAVGHNSTEGFFVMTEKAEVKPISKDKAVSFADCL